MLELKNISKRYRKGRAEVVALDTFSYHFKAGTLYAVGGASGAGKTTLLTMLGGMLCPDQGDVLFKDQNIYALSKAAQNRFRKASVGFVFQKFHLLPYLTVLDNIKLPLTLQGQSGGIDALAVATAERLGLGERLNHYPSELSVGQQQRVSIARVLGGDPAMILADEPTGNLDEENQRIISAALHQEAAAGKLVIVVTHEPALLAGAHVDLRLKDGVWVS